MAETASAVSYPPRVVLSALVPDRAMEAWYNPSIARMPPQPEGSHGKLHRTTKILSHARRRGGGVAARGTRAAAAIEDTAHRHHRSWSHRGGTTFGKHYATLATSKVGTSPLNI